MRYIAFVVALLCVSVAFGWQARIVSYEPFYARTSWASWASDTITLREITFDDGSRQYLILNTVTFQTEIADMCCVGTLGTLESLANDTPYFTLRRLIADNYELFAKGVGSFDGRGYMLTGDLCPTAKPLRRDFIEHVQAVGVAPIYLCVSGKWIERHAEDLEWLRSRGGIVWVNHSYDHYYDPKAPDTRNFLLRPGTDLRREILDAEQLMVENGLIPSPFFRYPGLISDARLSETLLAYGLIPLGSNAWIAKGEVPTDGSIVLVHVNGNEPEGLTLFRRWLANTSLVSSGF